MSNITKYYDNLPRPPYLSLYYTLRVLTGSALLTTEQDAQILFPRNDSTAIMWSLNKWLEKISPGKITMSERALTSEIIKGNISIFTKDSKGKFHKTTLHKQEIALFPEHNQVKIGDTIYSYIYFKTDEILKLFPLEDKEEANKSYTNQSKRGRLTKYNWDDVWCEVCIYIHEQGFPKSANELAQDIYEKYSSKHGEKNTPDIETIRKRIRPLSQYFNPNL